MTLAAFAGLTPDSEPQASALGVTVVNPLGVVRSVRTSW